MNTPYAPRDASSVVPRSMDAIATTLDTAIDQSIEIFERVDMLLCRLIGPDSQDADLATPDIREAVDEPTIAAKIAALLLNLDRVVNRLPQSNQHHGQTLDRD